MWTVMNEYLTNISNDYMLKAFENIFLWFLNHLKGDTYSLWSRVNPLRMTFTSAIDSKLWLIILNKCNI